MFEFIDEEAVFIIFTLTNTKFLIKYQRNFAKNTHLPRYFLFSYRVKTFNGANILDKQSICLQ